VETKAIEKKNLETHVELCAERYRFLESKLETLDEKITEVEGVVKGIHSCMLKIQNKTNDQIIKWGGAIIVGLCGVIGWLIVNFVA